MHNVKIDRVDQPDRKMVALGSGYVQGYILPPHQHHRAQLLYDATGLTYVTTQDGEWVVPPQYAAQILPEAVHVIRFAGMITRSLYIEPDYVAAFIKHRRCEVVSVLPLLRQLLLEVVDLPPLYDSPCDHMLIQLVLLELAVAPTRESDILLPQHSVLLALCQAFLFNPSIHDPAARWARALFMSPNTSRHYFPKQLGLSFFAWRQQVCMVSVPAQLITGKSMNEVALSFGYDNVPSFVTMSRHVTRQSSSFYHPAWCVREGDSGGMCWK